MVPDSLLALAEDVIEHLAAKGLFLALAESCTGGLCAATLTTIPGSSRILDRAYVVYSNDAKGDWLGVDEDLLESYGAVSGEVAHVLAEEALIQSKANLAFSATGIAGPGGGTAEKPVGLVYIGMAKEKEPVTVHRFQFRGDRRSIRVQIVSAMMEWMLKC